jgi:hypothetical protein
MATQHVTINRAPVLTLWAAVVAERLGYDRDTALTLGKAVAGLNAQWKARRLGVIEDSRDQEQNRAPGARTSDKTPVVTLLGRAVPAITTAHSVRAERNRQPMDPRGVSRYVHQTFGDALPEVRAAMAALAAAYPPEHLAAKAYPFYKLFRLYVPEGTRGWGAAGHLDLDTMRARADESPRDARRRR